MHTARTTLACVNAHAGARGRPCPTQPQQPLLPPQRCCASFRTAACPVRLCLLQALDRGRSSCGRVRTPEWRRRRRWQRSTRFVAEARPEARAAGVVVGVPVAAAAGTFRGPAHHREHGLLGGPWHRCVCVRARVHACVDRGMLGDAGLCVPQHLSSLGFAASSQSWASSHGATANAALPPSPQAVSCS